MNNSTETRADGKPSWRTGLNLTEEGSYAYDQTFYRYIQQGALRSARIVIPLVRKQLQVNSVLDVGCGAGAWLSEYLSQGVADCAGVDGNYVDRASLLIPAELFFPRDVSAEFDLSRGFDLVQCLEVGEHIEPECSATLVANLVRHGDYVLFSAAVPGQGGENHINERPYSFWRALFAGHGYAPYDFVRPHLRNAAGVEAWYRHNVVLYVAQRAQAFLPAEIRSVRVSDDEPIADVASPLWKLRTLVFARLPVAWISKLAILKHRSLLLGRALGRRK